MSEVLGVEIGREKPVSWTLRLGVRATALMRRLIGPRRALDVMLDLEWVSHRFAHELASDVLGEEYHVQARALSPQTLQRWVPQGSRVVDLGCGRGQWARIVAPLAAEVVGIDRDPAHIDHARQLGGPPNLRFVLGSINDLAEAQRDHPFDVGLLVHVIEHIDDDVSLLRDIRAVAARLILEVPDLGALATNYVRQERGRPLWTDADHVREYDLALLASRLNEAGWEVTEVQRAWGMLAVLADRR